MSRRLVVVWVALVLLTLVSSDASGSGAVSTTLATIAVLAACAAKAALIGLEYMGLSRAPVVAIVVFLAWTLGICVTLTLFFLRPDIMPVQPLLF